MTDKLAEAIAESMTHTLSRELSDLGRSRSERAARAVRRYIATCPTDELVELLGERLEGSVWTSGYHFTGPKAAT